MKKIVLLLVIVVLAGSAFAAAKPAAASKVVVKEVVVESTPAPAAAKSSGLIVGVDVGNPFVRFALSDSTAVDLGAFYGNYTSGAATSMTVWGRYLSKLGQVNRIKTYWGATLGVNSTSPGSTSTITANGLLGAEYAVTDQIGLYGNVRLLTYSSTSTGGTSTATYTILTGDFNAYTGIVVYL